MGICGQPRAEVLVMGQSFSSWSEWKTVIEVSIVSVGRTHVTRGYLELPPLPPRVCQLTANAKLL